MARQKRNISLPKRPGTKSTFIKVAACIVFVLGMLYVAYHEVLYEKPQPEIVYEQVVKENPLGQKLTVFLADGS